MHEISKFQIITAIVIMMFIFVIGAIYSSTKDAAENKAIEKANDIQFEQISDTKSKNKIIQQDKIDLQMLYDKVNSLEQGFMQVQNNIENIANNSNSANGDYNLRCKIRGVIEDGSIVYMAEDDAVQEAKANNRDLVMHCSY